MKSYYLRLTFLFHNFKLTCPGFINESDHINITSIVNYEGILIQGGMFFKCLEMEIFFALTISLLLCSEIFLDMVGRNCDNRLELHR